MDVCEIGPERDVEVITLIRRAWAARVDPRSAGHRFTFDDLRAERAGGATVVGVLDAAVLIGTATLQLAGDDLHVDSLAADPSRPRHGIGVALLESAAERGRRSGARRVTLTVSILQPDLVRWYVRQGFVVAPDRFRMTDSGRMSIAMVCPLDGAPVPDPVGDAVRALKMGALIGLPTETVYGLASDASDPIAVRSVFAAKGRPVDHPVIVHLARGSQLDDWATDIPDAARRLASALWPGPLTMVLRRASHVLDEVTGGRDTVGLRVPAHPLALAVLGLHGGGLAAPSANRFGRVSPTTAEHVREELGDRLTLVLDGGPCAVGLESTIVDLADPQDPQILRPGGTPIERIEEILGRTVRREPTGPARAPGMLRSHYAPLAGVEIVRTPEARDAVLAAWFGRRVRVIDEPDPDRLAPRLYGLLREADRDGIEVLVVVEPTGKGLGPAVRDRLRRAAFRHGDAASD